MKRILIKNSICGMAQTVINLILVFFTVPLFIKILGIESYGIFSLIMVMGSLNTLTSLGLNNALLKFISEQGRTEESSTDILVALVIVFALVFPVTTIVVFFNKLILLDVLKVPIDSFVIAQQFFVWIVLANALLLVGQVFKSVLEGLQKIHITSFQQIIYNIIYWGLIIIVLVSGYNLPEVGLAAFIAAFIWLWITIISMMKEWGGISFSGFQANFKNSAKKQLNYGLKIYSSGLISFFYEPLSKVLISHFIGVSAVGFFDIALRLKGQFMGFISKIFYPLFPFIAEQKDSTLIRKYIHDIEHKTFLIIIPVVAMTILLTNAFIELWIGKNVEVISVTAIYIISFHLVGSCTVIPLYQFLMAKDLAHKTILIQLTNVIFNTLFFLLTIKFIDYYALIVGNVAAVTSSFVLCLYYQNKYLNSVIFDSFLQLLKMILAFIIILLFGYLVRIVLFGHDLEMLLVTPVILSIVTVFCYKILGLVKRADIYRYFGKSNRISLMLVKIFND